MISASSAASNGSWRREIGQFEYLQHVVVGHRLLTTESWLEEFFEHLTVKRAPKRHPAAVRRELLESQRARKLRKADEVLRRAGLGSPEPGGGLRQPDAKARREYAE